MEERMNNRPGVMFYFDVRPCIKRLTLEEKGQLFEAILDYAEFGQLPELDGVLGIAWDFIQPKIDRDAGQYGKKIEQRRYAVYVREARKNNRTPLAFDEWQPLPDTERYRVVSDDGSRYPTTTPTATATTATTTTTTSTTEDKSRADKPPTRPRFSPPTAEEVKAYCAENGYWVDPQRFVDYYTSNGWRVGPNPMKDWKAAVRNWNGKEQSTTGQGKSMPEYGGEDNWSV